jgi:hypothetical protein
MHHVLVCTYYVDVLGDDMVPQIKRQIVTGIINEVCSEGKTEN